MRSGIGRTILPEGMKPPEHWHEAVETDENTAEHSRAFEADYRRWLDAGCPTGADWRDRA